ncbi:MAG: SAM-dependent chlorinase/fluorinase [Acidobacteriota bacterium]|nr:SAM-dependent chlorinase/fluorinase [Acidobacteriota bacterium]
MTKGKRGERRGKREKGRRGETSPLKSRFPISPSPSPPVSPSPSPPVSQSPRPRLSLITLLTDFGTADYFVSAMKGVILSVNPNARVVDITHEIPAQDIEAAAFTLLAAYPSFPSGTIHVAVVDPGVGSARRAILVETGGQFFVGPDNGIFSYVCECEPLARVLEVTNEEYFRAPVSSTFHGRDVFAPVAAALSTGIDPSEFGKQITNPVLLAPLKPENSKNGTVKARIIHIDQFGNCITNLTPRELTEKMIAEGAYLVANGAKVESFRNFFSDQAGRGTEVFGLWGSAGFLELAAKDKSAAKILKAKRGQPVLVRMREN